MNHDVRDAASADVTTIHAKGSIVVDHGRVIGFSDTITGNDS
jgi:hypothetical protein